MVGHAGLTRTPELRNGVTCSMIRAPHCVSTLGVKQRRGERRTSCITLVCIYATHDWFSSRAHQARAQLHLC
jgi:hypothetical protein